MDYATTFYLLLPFLITTFIYAFAYSGRGNPRLPPGPYPLPIIGNLLKLSNKPHRSLADLSKRYGPLMSLKLGSRTTIVVSSPEIAQELFLKHDHSVCDRSIPDTVHLMDHHEYSIVWLPAGDRWRRQRKISKECLFSGQSLNGSEQLRRKKVQELVDYVSRCCTNENVVNIGAIAFTTIVNVLSNLLFSKNLSEYDSKSSHEFKDAIGGMMEIGGKPNLVDFFPILRPLDPQRLASQGLVYVKMLFAIFDSFIDQRLKTREISSSTPNDVLDLLLNISLKDESQLSVNDMRHLFLDLFIAGTDTVSTTVEWAMTELIRNPKKLEKVRLELTEHMKNNDTTLQEHNIPRLHYLNAVIKETLRLHPPIPFLIPHQAVHDVEVKGFIVPKDAQILCNVWAIGRDPNVWSDPTIFMPERFLEVETDYRGQDFELIPFGAGRRMCPGLNIAHRMLHSILGSLIHNFDWKLEGNMTLEELDMEEKFGLTTPRNVPLVVLPLKRV